MNQIRKIIKPFGKAIVESAVGLYSIISILLWHKYDSNEVALSAHKIAPHLKTKIKAKNFCGFSLMTIVNNLFRKICKILSKRIILVREKNNLLFKLYSKCFNLTVFWQDQKLIDNGKAVINL